LKYISLYHALHLRILSKYWFQFAPLDDPTRIKLIVYTINTFLITYAYKYYSRKLIDSIMTCWALQKASASPRGAQDCHPGYRPTHRLYLGSGPLSDSRAVKTIKYEQAAKRSHLKAHRPRGAHANYAGHPNNPKGNIIRHFALTVW